jgi:methyltransferase (TIGR00027 family)
LTAAWVAAMRGAGAFLPAPMRLVDDPYGLRFAGRLRALREQGPLAAGARVTSPVWLRGRLRAAVVLQQLRTRFIDEDVDAFAASGGRQLVLLGAGFDCRAWRLRALEGATVFEVDHPATQAKKRALMEREPARARVVFVPWDFEREPLERLRARLGLDGHDAHAATMTISEGVLPYLTDEAVEATFAAVARHSGPGSIFTFTYFDRALLSERASDARGVRIAVRLMGEPFRHGFDPAALPRWLDERGFALARDETASALAARMLPSRSSLSRWIAESPLLACRHFASAKIRTG